MGGGSDWTPPRTPPQGPARARARGGGGRNQSPGAGAGEAESRSGLWELGYLLPRSIKLPHAQEGCERRAAGPAREGAPRPGELFPRLPAGARTLCGRGEGAQAEAKAGQQAWAWEPPGRKESHLGMFYANKHLAVG